MLFLTALMKITDSAAAHLKKLLERMGGDIVGIRFDGSVGSCRSSVPLLRPVRERPEGFLERRTELGTFFIPPEYEAVFETATLDYENGLFSKGLHLTWPHREGGCPNCGQH